MAQDGLENFLPQLEKAIDEQTESKIRKAGHVVS